MNYFDFDKVKDPGYFKDNCLEHHSDHEYFKNETELEAGISSFRHSLNGVWKFHYAKSYNQAIDGFYKETYSCKNWDDIRVPAHIQLEGYDVPQYANVQYPWEGREDIRPGEIPEHFNPVASYTKYFYIPQNMQNEKLFISFEGVESAFAIWFNGEFIGYHEDSFTTAEFELTNPKAGENKLSVQVFKWSAGSWCEDQDFFRFSGIYRDVYLFIKPKAHINDIKIKALPDESLTKSELEILLKNEIKEAAKLNISLSFDKEEVLNETLDFTEVLNFNVELKNTKLWSAEEPNLYNLRLTLTDNNGEIVELVEEKVGFRRFELKDGIMLLNNKRIVFKGANRHDFSSIFGRAVTKEEIIKDLLTMKQHNINAIRTSHYPNKSILYKLCDEYGFYLIDETNMETHGSWDMLEQSGDVDYTLPNDKKEWQELLFDRVRAMYERDKNHPCILIWSCGNESYGGEVIYNMSNLFRELDNTRLVHYEGVFNDRRYNGSSDIESQMYTSVENIKKFLEEDASKPFICCEYAHAMGNSGGALYKYTELTDTCLSYQGGFIWDYVDQTLYKKDRYGSYFLAYGGDFGERPTDWQFSANGLVYGGERNPKPNMGEIKFLYQNISALISDDKIEINNKNLFVNTDKFRCILTLEKEGKILERYELLTEVEPLSTAVYENPFKKRSGGGEYIINLSFQLKKDTVWANAGHEVAYAQYIYKNEDAESFKESKKGRLTVIKSPHNVGVRGDEFELIFSYLSGGLISYKYAGKEMLEALPKPNFWRAPTDNDCGNLMQLEYAQWKIASLYASQKILGGPRNYPVCLPVDMEEKEDSFKISFTYMLPTSPASSCILSYEVFADGEVKVELSYDIVKELLSMPEFGVIFTLNADYDRFSWYGLGPFDSYVDRKKGARLGIYESGVKDNFAAYVFPQESGNKEEVRYAKLTDLKGRGLIFRADKENINFSALPYSPHQIEEAAHEYELPPIHHTYVKVSKAQMGVGGDDSWGAKTHKEHLIDIENKERLNFSFYFKGI